MTESQKYYAENKALVLQKKKAYNLANKDSISEYQKEYYKLNKDKKKQKVKARYLVNKSNIIAKNVIYKRERRANDSFYKMSHNIRSLISGVLRLRGFSKDTKTSDLLCCSYYVLEQHIESQFVDGMSWDNYGTYWTYDHICPCAQARNEDELVKLQHYSNLRPCIDNLIKSNNKTLEGEKLCLILLNRQWIN